jgi:serine/threonine protein kinase
MSQDKSNTNDGNNSVAKDTFAEIGRVAVANSMLTESDVTAIATAVTNSKNPRSEQAFARQAVQMGKLTPFQAKLLLARDNSTLALGPYVLLDKIGQGGMGSVYKARHKSMERIVALKVLRRKSGLSQDSIKRFQREVLTAAKLIHPNIVTAFDAGEQNGIHYLVMEYVDAGDLKSLVDQQGPLPVAKALQYVMQAARGLQYAHEKQIIHRDIKPANLLVDQTGCVKILDLGLARIIREQTAEDDHSLTANGALMGTVDFLSPEQSLDTKTADARSDIYSLGCTLYTLLTGEGVFPAGTLVQKILAHRETPVPSIRARSKVVPEEVDVLLQKMLAKNPTDRPQSMALVAETLQNILAGNPVSDQAPQKTLTTSSEDAFLDTLIAGGQETVTQDTVQTFPQTPTSTLPQPLVWNDKSNLKAKPASSSRTKTKKVQSKSWPIGLVAGLILAIVGGGIAITLPGPTPKPLTLNFNPNQLREIAGASITIDQKSHGSISSGQNTLTISTEEGKHKLQIEKQGYEPFLYDYDTSAEASLNVTVSLRKQTPPPAPVPTPTPQPNPSEPPPKATDMEVKAKHATPTPLKPVSQPSPNDPNSETTPKPSPIVSDNEQPKTLENTNSKVLVVGLGTGELPDLNTALQQALPNDTILIKHRGPLDVSPIDLTGKTPLTIRGDTLNGIDYWPIIRQAKSRTTEISSDTSKQAWIYGENLEINFVNLHLGVGGYERQPLESILGCKQGAIELDNCTLTAAPDETNRLPSGIPFPVIRVTGTAKHNVRVNIKNSIIRGGRLENFIRVDGESDIFVKCANFLWAGGESDLVQLGHTTSSGNFEFEKTILYNAKSLCGIPPDRLTGSQSKIACAFDLQKTVVNFSALGNGGFVRFISQDDSGLNYDEWAKYIRIKADDLLLTQMTTPLPIRDKKSNMKDFFDAFSLNSSELFISDPGFRVRPTGRELHEIESRDFLVNLDNAGNRKPSRGFTVSDLGVDQTKLPNLLSCVMEEGRNNPSLATTPRGTPRILRVDSENGPYKTLEAAMKDLNDDEIIEIADNATYIPSRNFDLNPGNGVINVEKVQHISIRSAIDKTPTIVLTDSPKYQSGKTLWQSQADGSVAAILLLYASCRSMKIDGIHFRTDLNRNNSRHYFILTNASFMRISNCSFINFVNSKYPTFEDTFGGSIVIRPLTWEASNDRSDLHGGVLWIENSVFNSGPLLIQDKISSQTEAPNAIGYAGRADLVSESFVFRNSFFGPQTTVVNSVSGTPNQWISYENCTILGRPFSMNRTRTVRSTDFRDNLVITLPNPLPCNPISLLDELNVKGGGNAVWMQDTVLTPEFRETGALRVMPGPALKRAPIFNYQPPKSTNDVRKIIQVKPGQEVANMASDKGFVGFRPDRTKL